MSFRHLLSLLCFTWTMPFFCIAQVKIAGPKKGAFQPVLKVDGKVVDLLEGRTLTYDNGICGYLNKLLIPLAEKPIPGTTGLLTHDFYIQQSYFIQSKQTITDVLQECNDVNLAVDKSHKGFLINNHFNQPLVISGISGSLQMNG